MRGAIGLVVMLVIVYAAAGVGGIFTSRSVGDWYVQLSKPAWTPPSWVFGPAWTALYTMMAVAAWLVLRRGETVPVTVPLALFAVQLALNIAWSAIFFGARQPGWAVLDIALLWVGIAATMVCFWRVSTVAGVLFIPYLLWVSYASALNLAIWRMNP